MAGHAENGKKGFQARQVDEKAMNDMVIDRETDMVMHSDAVEKYSFMKTMDYKNRRANQKFDFTKVFYRPSDDFWAHGGATGDDNRPTLEDLHAIATRRIGVAWRATREVANDAVRNGFEFKTSEGKIKDKKDMKRIFKFNINANVKNMSAQWLTYDRRYGAGMAIKIYGDERKHIPKRWKPIFRRNGSRFNMHKEAPNLAPTRFVVLSPRYCTVNNLVDTAFMDYDEYKWEITGGVLSSTVVHPSRVEVLINEKEEGQWRGTPVMEPIWMTAMIYLSANLYILRGLAKWGLDIKAIHVNKDVPTKKDYTTYLGLMQDFEANDFYILGKEDKIASYATKISGGFKDFFEEIKEDISSGLEIPMPYLFGRAVSAGISGVGILVSREDYWNKIAKVQNQISDNMLKLYMNCGFEEVENLEIEWNLSMQKTDEQRYKETNMMIMNEILAVQLLEAKRNFEHPELAQQQKQSDKKPNDKTEPVKEPGNGGKKKLEAKTVKNE